MDLRYPTGLGCHIKFRYSIGLDLPIGLQNPAAIHGWIIPDGLIILVGDLTRRF